MAQAEIRRFFLNVDPFKYAYFANPYERPYNEDGSYRADVTYHSLPKMNDASSTTLLPPNGFNIMREIDETSSKVNNFSTTLRMGVEYRFIEKLKFAGLASYTFTNNKTDNTMESIPMRLTPIGLVSIVKIRTGYTVRLHRLPGTTAVIS